jgi:membrane protein implicated in regulation of membrane protease activity
MEFIQVWQIWLVVAVALFVIEIFTFTFVFACFSLGCIAAAVFSYFDMGIGYQALIFAVVTFACFFVVRPFMLKFAYRKAANVKTNVDALEGSIGRVEERIDNRNNTGRVIVSGDNWRAVSENDEIIEEKEKIEVVRVDSTTLIVKHLK